MEQTISAASWVAGWRDCMNFSRSGRPWHEAALQQVGSNYIRILLTFDPTVDAILSTGNYVASWSSLEVSSMSIPSLVIPTAHGTCSQTRGSLPFLVTSLVIHFGLRLSTTQHGDYQLTGHDIFT